MLTIRRLGLISGCALLVASVAQAEDITTKKLLIKDNTDPGKRQVQLRSIDTAAQYSDADNPGVGGASVLVYSASDVYCVLLPSGADWQDTGSLWKYKNKATKVSAQIGDGKLNVKIKSGVAYSLADDLTQGVVNAQVQFGPAGERYCLRCTGNVHDDAAKFQAKDCFATACDPEPSSCVLGGTTTITTSSTITTTSTTTTISSTTTTTSTTTSTSTTTTTLPCYAFVTKWGSAGSGNGQFQWPVSVAVDGSGNVFVVDSYNDRIQKFTNTGSFLAKWGSFGAGNGQFNGPLSVAVDSSGSVFVADSGNNRIQKFSNTGSFVTKWGTSGTGNGQFNGPVSVAVDSSGSVFVADSGNYRIQKFSNTGSFVTKWGTVGSAAGQFNAISGIDADGSGNIFASDWAYDSFGGYYYNNRIQKFTNAGAFVVQFGGALNTPQGLAADSVGNVFVADTHNSRIVKYANGGTFLTAWGSFGTGDGELSNPIDVAVDANGNVFVAEGDRIQKFACP